MLLLRLKRGVAEGELPDGPDWRAIATFYITVQQGMSIQARDGASRKTLLSVADCAMAAWDDLVSCGRGEGSRENNSRYSGGRVLSSHLPNSRSSRPARKVVG